MMKKTFFFFAAAALSFAACTKTGNGTSTEGSTPEPELMPVTVQFSGVATKAESGNPENDVNTLQVVLYRVNGDTKTYESYYNFDPTAMNGTIYIDKNKAADKYLIAAYANQETLTEATVLEDWSLFSEEESGDFQMYGEWFKNASELTANISIALNRQCSKVTVNKITLDWTNSANNYKTFKLKSMYLMDAEGVFANVHTLTDAIKTANPWLNKNGYKTNGQDAFLYAQINSVEVTESVPYNTAHVFYGYISDLSTHNETSTWTESGTRLVIEAEFDGETCYYAVPLRKDEVTTPYRNKHFVFENITITKPGASAPYEELVDETSISVSFSVAEWDTVNHGEFIIE